MQSPRVILTLLLISVTPNASLAEPNNETYLCVPDHSYSLSGGKSKPLQSRAYQSSDKWLLKFIPFDKSKLDGREKERAKLKDVWKFKRFSSGTWYELTRFIDRAMWNYIGINNSFSFNDRDRLFQTNESGWYIGDGTTDFYSLTQFGRCSKLD